MCRAAALLMFLGAAWALRAEGETVKQTLKYKVLMKGKKVGWANAFIDTAPDFVKVTLTWKVKTKVAGVDVKLGSKTVARYNAKKKVTYFDIQGERPAGTVHTVGKRSGGGYSITTYDGGKAEQIFIDDKSYDCVSLEPALWSGPVGSTKKLRLLFAARGEVGSAAVSVIGREKKHLFGREAQVTHYKIKAPLGSVEEWRLDDGVLIRSYLSAPIGKIIIELLAEP